MTQSPEAATLPRYPFNTPHRLDLDPAYARPARYATEDVELGGLLVRALTTLPVTW